MAVGKYIAVKLQTKKQRLAIVNSLFNNHFMKMWKSKFMEVYPMIAEADFKTILTTWT